jgi:hypothetical protein
MMKRIGSSWQGAASADALISNAQAVQIARCMPCYRQCTEGGVFSHALREKLEQYDTAVERLYMLERL